MQPIIRREIILDKKSPISAFSLETRKACEKALSLSHAEKIRRIEHATIKCHPKQVDHQLLSQRNWVYHFLEFTLDDLKQFLKHKLSHLLNEPIECYLTGSAAQPGNRPFNNIDLTLFPKRFDYSQYKYIINLFLFNLVLSHKDYNPETSVQAFWALDLLYYDRQEEFSNELGGLFCIRNIDSTSGPINIRIFSKPNNFSLGIAPFVSLNRYVLRLSLGQDFVVNGDHFEQALLELEKSFFHVQHPENVKHLIFPVLNKFTQFFAVEQFTFETAKFQLKKDFQSSTKQDEIEKEFVHHLLNHYQLSSGRIIDFLNLLYFFKYDRELCHFFAEVLLKNRRTLELDGEVEFAEVIKANPALTPDLLNFIGAVAYLDWNRNKGEGKRGEHFWSHFRETHPEKSITYTWMCYTWEERRLRVFLPRCRSINEVFGYIQIIHDQIKNEQELGYLRELLKCLHLDCTFLSPLGFEEIKKEMTTKKNDPKKPESDEKKEALKENQVEETICKALEMEKDPKGEAVRQLIKMFPCDDHETLISIFQAILGLADSQIAHKSLFKLFKELITSANRFKDLKQLICDTADLFAQKNPAFFKFCLKDSELNQLIVSAIEQYPRAEYYQMLLLLAENGTGIIQEKIFEIFNQILNEDEFNPNSIPLAIMLLEKKCPLTKEVRWEWLNKIVLRGLVNIEKDDLPNKDQIREECLKLLRLLDCEESRQEFITLLCLALSRSLEKTGWRSQVFFLFTQALAILLPGEQAEVLLKLKNDFSLDQEALAHRILPIIKQASVKEAESILKKLIKTRKTKVKKSSKDTASKLSEIFKGQTFYDPSAVESLFQLLTRSLTDEQMDGVSIKELITQATIYNTEHALSLAARLFKNGCDKKLLEEESLYQCGLFVLNGYRILFFDSRYSLMNYRKVNKNKEIIYGIVKRLFLLKRNFENYNDIHLLLQFLTCFKNDAEGYKIIFNLYCQYFQLVNNLAHFEKEHLEKFCHLIDEIDEIPVEFQNLVKIWKENLFQFKNDETIFTLLRAIQSKYKQKSLELITFFFSDSDKDKQSILLLKLCEYLQYSSDKEKDFAETSLDILDSFQKDIEQSKVQEVVEQFNQVHIFLLIEVPTIENFRKAFEIYRNKQLSDKHEAFSWILFFIPTIDNSQFHEKDVIEITCEMVNSLTKEKSLQIREVVLNGARDLLFGRERLGSLLFGRGRLDSLRLDLEKVASEPFSPSLDLKNVVSVLNHLARFDKVIITYLQFFIEFLIQQKIPFDNLDLENIFLKLIFQKGFSLTNFDLINNLVAMIEEKDEKFPKGFNLLFSEKIENELNNIFATIKNLSDNKKEKFSKKEISEQIQQLKWLMEQLSSMVSISMEDSEYGRRIIDNFFIEALKIKSIIHILPAVLHEFFEGLCKTTLYQPDEEPLKNTKNSYDIDFAKRNIWRHLLDEILKAEPFDNLVLGGSIFSKLLFAKYETSSVSFKDEIDSLCRHFQQIIYKALYSSIFGKTELDVEKLIKLWKIFVKSNGSSQTVIKETVNTLYQFSHFLVIVAYVLKQLSKKDILRTSFSKENIPKLVKEFEPQLALINRKQPSLSVIKFILERINLQKNYLKRINPDKKDHVSVLVKESTLHYLCELQLFLLETILEYLKLTKDIDVGSTKITVICDLLNQFNYLFSGEKNKELKEKMSAILKKTETEEEYLKHMKAFDMLNFTK